MSHNNAAFPDIHKKSVSADSPKKELKDKPATPYFTYSGKLENQELHFPLGSTSQIVSSAPVSAFSSPTNKKKSETKMVHSVPITPLASPVMKKQALMFPNDATDPFATVHRTSPALTQVEDKSKAKSEEEKKKAVIVSKTVTSSSVTVPPELIMRLHEQDIAFIPKSPKRHVETKVVRVLSEPVNTNLAKITVMPLGTPSTLNSGRPFLTPSPPTQLRHSVVPHPPARTALTGGPQSLNHEHSESHLQADHSVSSAVTNDSEIHRFVPRPPTLPHRAIVQPSSMLFSPRRTLGPLFIPNQPVRSLLQTANSLSDNAEQQDSKKTVAAPSSIVELKT